MQLTSEQVQEIDKGGAVAILVEGRECVIVRSDIFESQEQSLLSEWHPQTMRRQLADLMKDDWAAPEMSVDEDE